MVVTPDGIRTDTRGPVQSSRSEQRMFHVKQQLVRVGRGLGGLKRTVGTRFAMMCTSPKPNAAALLRPGETRNGSTVELSAGMRDGRPPKVVAGDVSRETGQEAGGRRQQQRGPVSRETGPLWNGRCGRLAGLARAQHVHDPVQIFHTGKFNAYAALPRPKGDLDVGVQPV